MPATCSQARGTQNLVPCCKSRWCLGNGLASCISQICRTGWCTLGRVCSKAVPPAHRVTALLGRCPPSPYIFKVSVLSTAVLRAGKSATLFAVVHSWPELRRLRIKELGRFGEFKTASVKAGLPLKLQARQLAAPGWRPAHLWHLS